MNQRRLSRRRFAGVLATPLALSGCTFADRFSSAPPGDENTINLWYWNRSIDESLFREFEAQHPGITVNDQKIGGDYAAKFITSLAGQAFIPDVVALNEDIARYFPNEGEFEDLYELGAQDLSDQYLDWKWAGGVTQQGRMIGFPMDTGPLGLYYRADLFEQAGLPTEPDEVTAMMAEWQDYFDAGVELQGAIPGVKMMDNAPYLYIMGLMQAKLRYVDENRQYVGNGDHVRRAWDLALEADRLDLTAGVDPFTPDWSAGVSESRFASFVGAVWMKQYLEESGPNVVGTWRVAQPPGGPGNQGGSFIGVTKYARNKELAFELIKFVQSPENQVAMYHSLNLFPSALEALNDPVMSEPEEFFGGQATSEQFAETSENLEVFYVSPAYAIAHSVMTSQVENLTVGGAEEEGAWEDAQDQIRRELSHKAPWVEWKD